MTDAKRKILDKVLQDIKHSKWIVLIFCIILIGLCIYNSSANPFINEKNIRYVGTIRDYNLGGFKISERIIESRIGVSFPETRTFVYLTEFTIIQDKDLGNSVLYSNSGFLSIPFIKSLIYHPVKIEKTTLENKYQIYSDNPELAEKIFTSEVTHNIMDLIKRDVITQNPIINSLAIHKNEMQVRIYLVRTQNNMTLNDISSYSKLSEQEKQEIIQLLVLMAEKANK